MTREEWNEMKNIVECRVCGARISSSYPGDWVKCDCDIEGDFIYIDQTEYYTRLGGDMDQIIYIKMKL